MKYNSITAIVAGLVVASTSAFAGEDSVLSIEGQEFITQAAAPAHMENVDTIYSGWVFRTDETQALEMDDFDNPSFVFVEQAENFSRLLMVALEKPVLLAMSRLKCSRVCVRRCHA
jgi:sulfur-oxidizing protein SoxA